jgi:hypothetical protein
MELYYLLLLCSRKFCRVRKKTLDRAIIIGLMEIIVVFAEILPSSKKTLDRAIIGLMEIKSLRWATTDTDRNISTNCLCNYFPFPTRKSRTQTRFFSFNIKQRLSSLSLA